MARRQRNDARAKYAHVCEYNNRNRHNQNDIHNQQYNRLDKSSLHTESAVIGGIENLGIYNQHCENLNLGEASLVPGGSLVAGAESSWRHRRCLNVIQWHLVNARSSAFFSASSLPCDVAIPRRR